MDQQTMLSGAMGDRSRPSRAEQRARTRAATDPAWGLRLLQLQTIAATMFLVPGLHLYEENGDRDGFLWVFLPNVANVVDDVVTPQSRFVGSPTWICGSVGEALERQILGIKNS